MKILQKLKFMFARKDTPTEVRPDDMTSKKDECCDHDSHPEYSEGSPAEKKEEGCCDHGCDCK